MRISDWSSDVCSSDLEEVLRVPGRVERLDAAKAPLHGLARRRLARCPAGNRRAHRLAELVQQGVVVEGVVDRGGHGGLGREGSVASSCRRADRRARAKWGRSEEHTSELQSLMRTSYAVFCFKKK